MTSLYWLTVNAQAEKLFNLYYGDKDAAFTETFNAAKAYSNSKDNLGKNCFWRDVFLAIQKM